MSTHDPTIRTKGGTPKRLRLLSAQTDMKPGMFDERPIKLPGWHLQHRRALPLGIPTIEQTQHAASFADGLHDSSPFWLADIIHYISERADWGEKASQITLATGVATETAYTMASLMKRVAQAERDVAQSISHAKLIAKLTPSEQHRWLKKSRNAGWGIRELDQQLKASQKRGVLTTAAELEGMFRVWLVDFPWKHKQAQPSMVKAESHYPGMTVEQGIKMGSMVQAHATKQAVMFFWVTAPQLYYASDDISPDPYRIIRSWGFKPKTGGVWDKVAHNFGHYLSIRHEHLIICTRGSCTPDHPVPMFDSVFAERKSGVHSEKPGVVYKMIERMYEGKRVELFARQERKGWTCYGNQIGEPVAAAKAG
jgi:N6-adenosine-specific RNA methylase IME4